MESVILKNQDVMEKMMEIMPKLSNQTTYNKNSHNTTNNQFNIQMFLNEHCKNAMNLTDFIDSLPITADTYDSTIENGLIFIVDLIIQICIKISYFILLIFVKGIYNRVTVKESSHSAWE